jgi:Spy/CpxP family protein refolding chaperone
MIRRTDLPAISLPAILLLACAFFSTQAQTPKPTPPTQDAPPAQTAQAPNWQAELNLTPEQIQKWRALNRELREQEQAGNLRLRDARRGLAEAMESTNPSEELIKQRAKELADAQSAMTQLQALRQARVLQILTPEQRIKMREIRARNQALIRERRDANQQQMPRPLQRRQNALQRNQNPNALTPRQQQRILRQQQQPRKNP